MCRSDVSCGTLATYSVTPSTCFEARCFNGATFKVPKIYFLKNDKLMVGRFDIIRLYNSSINVSN